ncbi:chloride channel protein, CIC family [Sphingobacterium nematocida]|uniref:Chloride channel protein, CIC family n=1 Tax=Sphingobacterium nematocida TaxID=1513896 RepID=A0A1T5AQH3_9SPHI|nr:chloride channel protein [Sphingobacterium nematocida]SKB37228.1 chloride channel protein, CIC family [Sphingobacterium nematocida]
MQRRKTIFQSYLKLIILSVLVAFICSLLGLSLKFLTEFFESKVYTAAISFQKSLLILLPSIGITAIYFLRKYLFQNRKNKGITEIYKTLDQRKDHLPFFKIPSHYLNGFLTVISGGSTGVEVSTVVATATVGNVTYEQNYTAKKYKRELVCAGVAAGVAVLFASPLAGWFFAMEVIAKKRRKSIMVSCTVSAFVAWLFIHFFESKPFFSIPIQGWNWNAIPFFLLLSLFASVLSVYFTILVIWIKTFFAKIHNNFIRVNSGAILVGLMLFFFPILYGDSYHGLIHLVEKAIFTQEVPFLLLIALILLKPIAASLTLGAGGDGGVFAPSIVAGAFLGLLFASLSNHYLGTHLIVFNFVLLGAASTLSSAIFAPFTAMILVSSMAPNGYDLLVPLFICCLLSRIVAQKLLPYNVYTYDFYQSKHTKVSTS